MVSRYEAANHINSVTICYAKRKIVKAAMAGYLAFRNIPSFSPGVVKKADRYSAGTRNIETGK